MGERVLYFLKHPPGQQLEDDENLGEGVPQEYIDFKIMRMMGWDWHTYHNQPDFFIEMITAFLYAEGRANARINVRSKDGK